MARRMGPLDYFEATMDLLARDGFPALKQSTLCASLGVTTGSFYTHFASWQDFTQRFLEYWTEYRTRQLTAYAETTQGTDPIGALTLLAELTTSLPHKAEASIRAWSVVDAEVAAVQRNVDELREAAVFRAMNQLFDDPQQAANFSRGAMYILVGFEQYAAHDADPRSLLWTLNQLLEHVKNVAPADRVARAVSQ